MPWVALEPGNEEGRVTHNPLIPPPRGLAAEVHRAVLKLALSERCELGWLDDLHR